MSAGSVAASSMNLWSSSGDRAFEAVRHVAMSTFTSSASGRYQFDVHGEHAVEQIRRVGRGELVEQQRRRIRAIPPHAANSGVQSVGLDRRIELHHARRVAALGADSRHASIRRLARGQMPAPPGDAGIGAQEGRQGLRGAAPAAC